MDKRSSLFDPSDSAEEKKVIQRRHQDDDDATVAEQSQQEDDPYGAAEGPPVEQVVAGQERSRSRHALKIKKATLLYFSCNWVFLLTASQLTNIPVALTFNRVPDKKSSSILIY